MLFTSFSYAMFFAAVFALYWRLPHRYRWVLLLAASYFFYICWEPRFALLLIFVTAAAYSAALLLERENRPTVRKLILTAAAICALTPLFIFKYYGFFAENLTALLGRVGIRANISSLRLLLPVGISFYSFQSLGYVIDVYRKQQRAERHFGIFAAFVSFFPVISSGPIQRSAVLLPQLREERHFDQAKAAYAMKLILWGLFKKLAIADLAAGYVNAVYAGMDVASGLDAMLAVFLYTVQIYCDFSGYSDMAIGSAGLLGIELKANFKSPYFASTLREFWSRWHISLSTWFRDYLYIPLGGSRCGKIRRGLNLMITFLVSGLWHGADWSFVVWGGLHGAAQLVGRRLEQNPKGAKKLLRGLVVFIFCNVAWVFFRAAGIGEALCLLEILFRSLLHPGAFLYSGLCFGFLELLPLLLSIALLALYDFFALKTGVIEKISTLRRPARWGIYLAFCFIVLLRMPIGDAASFIYFGF